MFKGLDWVQYIKTIAVVVFGYYVVIGWIYRKEWLQWWRDRIKK